MLHILGADSVLAVYIQFGVEHCRIGMPTPTPSTNEPFSHYIALNYSPRYPPGCLPADGRIFPEHTFGPGLSACRLSFEDQPAAGDLQGDAPSPLTGAK